MIRNWNSVPIFEVLEVADRWERPDPGTSYRQLGVRLWGEGAYERETIDGEQTNYSSLNCCGAGDLVVNKIWARNGSVAIVPEFLAGSFVSSEFPLYTLKENVIPNWLRLITKSKWFWQACDEKARGTSGKNRIRPEKFLEIEIPLPTLSEQKSICELVEAVEYRIEKCRMLRSKQDIEGDALSISLHYQLADRIPTKVSQLLKLEEEKEVIEPSGSYPQVGIRSFGNGMFKKPAVSGGATSYRAFNTLRPGMFVMSQVKGWEGAVAVCDDELDGWFVSPEYRTFRCIEDACDPEYLSYLVQTDWFHKQLAEATRGQGARRERVRPEMLLELEMPFPRIEDQRRAVRVLRNLHKIKAQAAKVEVRHEALMPSLLDRIFNQHDTTGLGD
ncbi:MAG: restriction endonuclease subunit S [Verrucomicrobiales bacterium]